MLNSKRENKTTIFTITVGAKNERILLLARSILVMRICIFKYDIFWLGRISILLKRRTLGVITTKNDLNMYFHKRNCIHLPFTVYLLIRMSKYF